VTSGKVTTNQYNPAIMPTSMVCTLQGAPECQSFVFSEEGKCTSYTGGEPPLSAEAPPTEVTSRVQSAAALSLAMMSTVGTSHSRRVHHGPAGGQHAEDGRAIRHSGCHRRGGAAAEQLRIMLLSTVPSPQHSSKCGTPRWMQLAVRAPG
jgi:hypothetical protein